MDARIARCYRGIDPFEKFPAGHAPVSRKEARKLIGALEKLVKTPPFGSRYPTGRRRVAGKRTVYEVKMLMYLEALSSDSRAQPLFVITKQDQRMLQQRDGTSLWPENPYKSSRMSTESEGEQNTLQTESDSD